MSDENVIYISDRLKTNNDSYPILGDHVQHEYLRHWMFIELQSFKRNNEIEKFRYAVYKRLMKFCLKRTKIEQARFWFDV